METVELAVGLALAVADAALAAVAVETVELAVGVALALADAAVAAVAVETVELAVGLALAVAAVTVETVELAVGGCSASPPHDFLAPLVGIGRAAEGVATKERVVGEMVEVAATAAAMAMTAADWQEAEVGHSDIRST
jgi:hypothetical protein